MTLYLKGVSTLSVLGCNNRCFISILSGKIWEKYLIDASDTDS